MECVLLSLEHSGIALMLSKVTIQYDLTELATVLTVLKLKKNNMAEIINTTLRGSPKHWTQ